jgi:hypothetical protein
MYLTKLAVIHDSLVNGQKKQMVQQIEEYGLYDFWSDYKEFLNQICAKESGKLVYFTDATISYFRIKQR